LNNWAKPIGINDLTGIPSDYINQPLVNQPGSRWEYGINIDWAGIMVMRVTGMSLNDYFQDHIFKPLGVKNVNMFPTPEMKKNLAYMHQRGADGKLELEDHPNHRALVVETEEDIKVTFNSGGAGCFAQPSEYCSELLE
jgi:CubicO group peptidase (beta-lactamase class C family)